MYKFLRKSGIFIPKEYQHEDFYWKIKEFLARRTKKYNTPDYILNIFFLESEKGILIPRFFPLERFVSNYKINDKIQDGQKINISHNIKPRNEVQDRAIKFLLGHDNGILQLMPGVGKTVVAIYMIATRKQKTFILVHKDGLADQWRGENNKRIKQGLLGFTNLKDNDVARLTSATYKKDLQKPIIICTDQTFLSLLKRDRRDFLTSLNNSNIGVFIADEVHTTVGAPSFSECSIHVPAKYCYGLSATPYRFDGNEDIIRYHLGPIFSDEDAEGTMDTRVTVLLLDYEVDTPKRYRYLWWGGQFQRSRYLNLMRKSKPFMDVSYKLLEKFKNSRDILFVAERLKLIDDLYSKISFENKAKFVGSEKIEKLNYKLVFGTPGKMRDGIDAPHKDCLIMTSPISNVEQMVGRVVRTKPGKQEPIIIDMVDIGSRIISKTVYKRVKFYESKGWPIQFVIAINGGVKKITKEEAYEIIKGE